MYTLYQNDQFLHLDAYISKYLSLIHLFCFSVDFVVMLSSISDLLRLLERETAFFYCRPLIYRSWIFLIYDQWKSIIFSICIVEKTFPESSFFSPAFCRISYWNTGKKNSNAACCLSNSCVLLYCTWAFSYSFIGKSLVEKSFKIPQLTQTHIPSAALMPPRSSSAAMQDSSGYGMVRQKLSRPASRRPPSILLWSRRQWTFRFSRNTLCSQGRAYIFPGDPPRPHLGNAPG